MLAINCFAISLTFYYSFGQTISTRGVDDDFCHGEENIPGVHMACNAQKRHKTAAEHLIRIKPHKVGEEVDIVIKGQKLKRITRALQPPVYEIPNFLTDEECKLIIASAQQKGLHPSSVFDSYTDITKEMKAKDIRDIVRVSNSSFLSYHGEQLIHIREKVVELTHLPKDIVFGSEQLQVLRYGPGGHYHAHWDSEDTEASEYKVPAWKLPCCHLSKHCKDTVKPRGCCRICRFATVLFYLNDVEEGGETAFPWALLNDNDKLPPHDDNRDDNDGNLSYNCKSARLVVKPRKGTAILWYSHFLDDKGWMDKVDPASFHGGCDVLKGTKWIANAWINAPKYSEKDIRSVWSGK